MSTYDANYVSLCFRYVNLWFRRQDELEMVEALQATSRHSKDSPWLLPSGPDQVDEIPMREDQQSPHNNAVDTNDSSLSLQCFSPWSVSSDAKAGSLDRATVSAE